MEIEGTPIASLVDIGLMKLATIKDRGMPTLARAMAYFEEAEEQPMPDLRENVSWEDVRRFSEEGARYIVRRGTGR